MQIQLTREQIEQMKKDNMKQKYTYWECTQDGHNKFWAATIQSVPRTIRVGNGEIDKTNYVIIRRWGAIGTEGQSMQQEFTTMSEAEEMLQKLIWDKERKGYKGVF